MKKKLIFLGAFLMALILLPPGFSQEPQKSDPADSTSGFYDVQKKLDQGGGFYLYVNVKDALKNFLNEIGDAMRQSGMPIQAQGGFAMADQLLEALGLYDIEDFGMSVIDVGDMKRTKSFLRIPGSRKGIFGVLGGDPHSFESLQYAPADTMVFNCFDLDAAKGLRLARINIQKLGGEVILQQFNSSLQELGNRQGFDLEKVIQSLDGEFLLIGRLDMAKKIHMPVRGSENLAFPTHNLALGARVKDATLFDAIGNVLQKNNIPFESKTSENLKRILIKETSTEQSPLSPTIVFDGKYVLFATHEDYLDKILSTKKSGANLSDTEEFIKLTSGLPKRGNELIFISEQFNREMTQSLQKFLQMQTGISENLGRSLAPPMLFMSGIMKDMEGTGAMAGVRLNDEDGILGVCHNSGNYFKSMLMAGTMPISFSMAALSLHKVPRANLMSRVSRTKSDLRSMATALEAYNVDWSNYPPSPGFNSVLNEGPGITTWASLYRLTTPIAYITKVCNDPFSKQDGDPIFCFHADGSRDPGLWQQGLQWIIWSVGPDGIANFRSKGDFLGEGWIDLVYDPTNGVTSSGDIMRTNRGWHK